MMYLSFLKGKTMSKKVEEAKWRDLLYEIEQNVTEVSYRTWFLPLTPIEVDEKAKTISFACSDVLKSTF